jgi:hypothetical protein
MRGYSVQTESQLDKVGRRCASFITPDGCQTASDGTVGQTPGVRKEPGLTLSDHHAEPGASFCPP